MTYGTADRVRSLGSWHDDWLGLRVAVLGLNAHGFAAADTLVELGGHVRVIAAEADDDLERLIDVIGAELFTDPDAPTRLGELAAFAPDLIIATPGIAADDALRAWALKSSIPVWGDLELGWRLRDKTSRIADWLTVAGGSDGDAAQAVDLTARMLLGAGLRAHPVTADASVLDALRDPQGYDGLVLELDAARLRDPGTISPLASLCLGRPGSAAPSAADESAAERPDADPAAAADLGRVYEGTEVACVYDRADPFTERLVEDADVVEGARAISFGLDSPPPSGFGIVEGILVDRAYHAARREEAFEIVTLDELAERGLSHPSTVRLVLASAALARARGVEPDEIASAILRMSGGDR